MGVGQIPAADGRQDVHLRDCADNAYQRWVEALSQQPSGSGGVPHLPLPVKFDSGPVNPRRRGLGAGRCRSGESHHGAERSGGDQVVHRRRIGMLPGVSLPVGGQLRLHTATTSSASSAARAKCIADHSRGVQCGLRTRSDASVPRWSTSRRGLDGGNAIAPSPHAARQERLGREGTPQAPSPDGPPPGRPAARQYRNGGHGSARSPQRTRFAT
jgi:hypothetical protein